jgi:hypothetical protein
MGKITWPTNKAVRHELLLLPYLRPGQFELRWPRDCFSCGVRMSRGDAAGYVDGEIVCDDCYA